MPEVIILNAGAQQILGTVTVRHAAGMLFRHVAKVYEAEPGVTFGPYPMPRSVELVRWIYTAWAYDATKCTRAAVLRRDNYRCAYCGRPGATLDHIVPKSRGGRTTWTNCVAACPECNGKKADRTPVEAGMMLRVRPAPPRPGQLVAR